MGCGEVRDREGDRANEGGWRAWFQALPPTEVDVSEHVLQSLHDLQARRDRPWLLRRLPAFAFGALAGIAILAALPSLRPRQPGPLRPGVDRVARLHSPHGVIWLDDRRLPADGKVVDLYPSNRLRMAEGASAILAMGAAETLLKGGAEARIDFGRLELRLGKAFVHFTPSKEGFRVETPLLICAVRGTRFVVDARVSSSKVTLVEGRVAITTPPSAETGNEHVIEGSASFEIDALGQIDSGPQEIEEESLDAFARLEGRTPGDLKAEIDAKGAVRGSSTAKKEGEPSAPSHGGDTSATSNEEDAPTGTSPAPSPTANPTAPPTAVPKPPKSMPGSAPEIRFLGVGVQEGKP